MSFVEEPVTLSTVEEWRQLNSTSINNCSISGDADSLFVYRFSQSFMFYGLSIIVPFGLLSNSLSLIVFMTRPMRRRASSWYLAALSLSDSISLLAIALDYWLKNDRVGLQWMRTSELTCIAVTHLSYTSRLLSAWLVTTFTVERFISVVYPLQRSSLISMPLARRVIGFETLGCVLLSSFTLFTIGLVEDDNSPSHYECDIRRERAQTYLICNVLFLIFGSIVIPILTIVTLNLAILKRFFNRDENLTSAEISQQHQHHHKDLASDQKRQVYHVNKRNGHTPINHLHIAYEHQQQNSSPHPPNLPPAPPPASLHPQCHLHHHSSHSSTAIRRDITTVLIAVSATFVILNVPYCICWFLLNFRRRIDLDLTCAEHVTKLTLYAAKYISSVPYFLNYGLNFVLYSLCARSFRAQLWRTVTCEVTTGRSRPPSHCIHHHSDSKTNGGAKAVEENGASSDHDVVHG